ncbi:F-box domain-containing protein [Colletotrichum orchidophilum]|uniref:F-box domain-containing protein n=1 Tax=Colletotrichum orchidophilum TaxID=1209926 RepID=A0A1G4BJF1_9PEZI|nr:F-box domain-containing protein [Colletotrichum orchidophilum]OHF01620.1 F-box domain-containing protein [Colletotrichum orchidophilum]
MPAQSTNASLGSLPNELKRMIAGFVHTNEISNCSSSSVGQLSLVNRCFRALTVEFVFGRIEIQTTEDRLHHRVKAIAKREVIKKNVRFLTLTVDSSKQSGFTLPPQVPAQIAAVCKQMVKLEEMMLMLLLPGSGPTSLAGRLRHQLRFQNVRLPKVKALVICAVVTSVTFIPGVFPNLETLSLDVHVAFDQIPELLEVGNALTNLTTLRVAKQAWSEADLPLLARASPKIKYLLLEGGLDNVAVSILAPNFRRFKELSCLVLTTEQDCGVPDSASLDDEECEMANMFEVENHPLNEEHEDNARGLAQNCPKLLEVTLIRQWYAQRFGVELRFPNITRPDVYVISIYGPDDTQPEYWKAGVWPRTTNLC